MGKIYIEGFKGLDVNIDTLLSIHLKSNHFPPVNSGFIPDCKKAIEACISGDVYKKIKMCNGVTLEAYKIAEGLHLDSFIDEEEDFG